MSKIFKATQIKTIIAPDKFRPKLSAEKVCQIIQEELPKKYSALSLPLADGGEGSLQCIQKCMGIQRKTIQVKDPLFRNVDTWYLFDSANKIAYIQMAKASGINILSNFERNPLKTSTYGTGQLIKNAIQGGSKLIYLFIGGSATNEGGIGAASALGFKFYNRSNQQIAPVGQNLHQIQRIVAPNQSNFSNWPKIKVATDVDSPLTGPKGATHVYSAQKGATFQMKSILERGMQHYSKKLSLFSGIQVQSIPGGGAAGGLGAGCKSLLKADIVSGIDTISQILGLQQKIKQTDIVITGEGKVDEQTLNGKVVKRIVDISKKYLKPVYIFCGKADIPLGSFGENVKIIQNQADGMAKQYSIQNAQKLLRQRVRTTFAG